MSSFSLRFSEEITAFIDSEGGNGRLKEERALLKQALEDVQGMLGSLIGYLRAAVPRLHQSATTLRDELDLPDGDPGHGAEPYSRYRTRPFGTAAEYVVVPAHQAVRLPDDLSELLWGSGLHEEVEEIAPQEVPPELAEYAGPSNGGETFRVSDLEPGRQMRAVYYTCEETACIALISIAEL
jgi:hypothetical protein